MNLQVTTQETVIEELERISVILDSLELYEPSIQSNNDVENMIFYSNINDQIKQKLKEIKENA